MFEPCFGSRLAPSCDVPPCRDEVLLESQTSFHAACRVVDGHLAVGQAAMNREEMLAYKAGIAVSVREGMR